MIRHIVNLIKWWWKEIDNICPHCGYYCNCSSVFCCPPDEGEEP